MKAARQLGSVRSGRNYTYRPRKPKRASRPIPNLRILTRKKSNAARRDETIELRWHDGVFVPLHSTTGIAASIERRTARRVFYDLLNRALAEGQYLSNNSRAGNYAPRIFAMRPDRERFVKADFERAMHDLLATKEIVLKTHKDAYRRDINCLVCSTLAMQHGVARSPVSD